MAGGCPDLQQPVELRLLSPDLDELLDVIVDHRSTERHKVVKAVKDTHKDWV